jgi:phage FluMu protein gp41
MYSVSNILKNKDYPSWIAGHPIFKDVSIYDKIFPKMGLQNGSAPLKTLLAEEQLHSFIADLIYVSGKVKSVLLEREPSPPVCALLKFFTNLTSADYLTISRGNKISITLSEDITDSDEKVIFRKGSSLFALLEKLVELDLPITNVFSFDSFKDFSRLNIPLSSAEICFSTDPWDIATMSMRGFSTCQSWSGEYRQSVIGSMLDPYVGVIYLASKGKPTEYGTKMLFRSTVRFAVNNTGAEKPPPVLIIDHVYPEPFPEVFEIFSEFLTEKSGLEVLYAPDIEDDIHDGLYFLPRAQIRDMFKYYSLDKKHELPVPLENSIRSYQNITIKDKPERVASVDSLKLVKEKIKEKFVSSLIKNSSTAAIELSRFSSSKINTLLALKNKNFSFQAQINITLRTFANKLVREINFEEKLDEHSYGVKLYLNYFHKRNYLLESMSSQVSQWNGSLSLKKSAALSRRDFIMIMQQAMQQADQALKAELKAFFAARRVDNRPTSD